MSLDAYYFGFYSTGVVVVDDILRAVAAAGKAFHHTEFWSDPMEHDYRCIRAGQTPADAIEEAAKNAADEIERLEAWKAEAIEVLARWEEVAELVPMQPGDVKSQAVKDWVLSKLEGES